MLPRTFHMQLDALPLNCSTQNKFVFPIIIRTLNPLPLPCLMLTIELIDSLTPPSEGYDSGCKQSLKSILPVGKGIVQAGSSRFRVRKD